VIRRRVLVGGRVQAVGFRQACADAARRVGVAGWVRNRRDGRVEAAFEGPAPAVSQLVEWCRSGPALAKVTDFEVVEEEPEGLGSFRVAATE
jgi:acylphosphatase